ncbi:hypothetical protein ABT298_36245 [Streptomyces sp. NPDC001034]
MTKKSRVRINLGNKSGAKAKPVSRVRIHLRDETPRADKPAKPNNEKK